MNTRIASKLINWEEFGFREEIIIYETVGVSEIDNLRIERAGLRYKVVESNLRGRWNYSGSLKALKSRIRNELAVKGLTKKFKWKDA